MSFARGTREELVPCGKVWYGSKGREKKKAPEKRDVCIPSLQTKGH
jgi:hypothetical protein